MPILTIDVHDFKFHPDCVSCDLPCELQFKYTGRGPQVVRVIDDVSQLVIAESQVRHSR